MSTQSRFPNSARALWLARQARSKSPSPLSSPESRALARELASCLREASLDQLRQVARVLGKTPNWVDLVCLDARNPGVVGKACLKAVR